MINSARNELRGILEGERVGITSFKMYLSLTKGETLDQGTSQSATASPPALIHHRVIAAFWRKLLPFQEFFPCWELRKVINWGEVYVTWHTTWKQNSSLSHFLSRCFPLSELLSSSPSQPVSPCVNKSNWLGHAVICFKDKRCGNLSSRTIGWLILHHPWHWAVVKCRSGWFF